MASPPVPPSIKRPIAALASTVASTWVESPDSRCPRGRGRADSSISATTTADTLEKQTFMYNHHAMPSGAHCSSNVRVCACCAVCLQRALIDHVSRLFEPRWQFAALAARNTWSALLGVQLGLAAPWQCAVMHRRRAHRRLDGLSTAVWHAAGVTRPRIEGGGALRTSHMRVWSSALIGSRLRATSFVRARPLFVYLCALERVYDSRGLYRLACAMSTQ